MPIAAHLPILPVLLPLAGAAIIMLFDERRRALKAGLSVAATLLLLAVAVALLLQADAGGGTTSVYRLGDWPAPFGIVLVADRLSALMVLLTSLLGLATLLFSLARWHGAGAHFHTLFQVLLMGLNGAFLTGDLFNLFVFFEVMLAASFGLLLHGSGPARIRAGLHYIAINLVASMLFLLGVSLVYGVTGTLNMADLATRLPLIAPGDRTLLEAGAALLGIAFLIKAGMWPLCFWLPQAYSVASAPVAAVFVITSKVAIYVILRLFLLLFGPGGGAPGFGSAVLLAGGLATIGFGAIGVLASQGLGRIASFSTIVSSGTLLAAIGLATPGVTAGALFYLVSSSLAICAFFLLIELVERGREPGADMLAVTAEAFGEEENEATHESEEVGIAIPAVTALLGIGFVTCAILIAGLPPLSGFVAKFAMMTAALDPAGLGAGQRVRLAAWGLLGLLLASGFAALLAMVRTGIRIFWAPHEGASVQRVRVIEFLPVTGLISLCVLMTIAGEPVMAYMRAAADAAHRPAAYIDAVMRPAASVSEARP
ncbi:monovalent cation/H+ antiporter subunit D [Aureimonas endophytica]|uniref:Monovalent cation/H+ antiporter subunit D n=1 Tax=Aureimonas endophytica TaxID=2027858 RepID=A0A916ZX56_9HYPH|nr:monovalent cation/H+ antiporter subunit D [Aureimonas endophytica]GGE17590.1 monovalent cation/H+ antiporter subunit D [Aureimonas endophytica]